MKKQIFILWIFCSSVISSYGLSTALPVIADVQKDIAEAIRTGNVSLLAKYFNTTIDLTVPGNESTFSKAQAEIIIKEFFTKNPPSTFKINHNGSSKDGSMFFIGTYITKQNKSFRTYYLLKKSGDKYVIQQLQFEQD